MCKWVVIFVSLVTPHLEIDYFYKNIKIFVFIIFYFLKSDVVSYCSQNGGSVFPPNIFQELSVWWGVKPHIQLPIQWSINFIIGSQVFEYGGVNPLHWQFATLCSLPFKDVNICFYKIDKCKLAKRYYQVNPEACRLECLICLRKKKKKEKTREHFVLN